MQEKKYIQTAIKAHVFQDGSQILKVGIPEEGLKEMMANLKNGWFNGVLSRRKEPSDKGITHYIYVDTYEPKTEKKSPAELMGQHYNPPVMNQNLPDEGYEEPELNLSQIPF